MSKLGKRRLWCSGWVEWLYGCLCECVGCVGFVMSACGLSVRAYAFRKSRILFPVFVLNMDFIVLDEYLFHFRLFLIKKFFERA